MRLQLVRAARRAAWGRDLRLQLEACALAALDEEAHGNRRFTHHDDIAVGEATAIDINDKIARREPGERPHHAALEFIVRRARADHFAYRECKEIADA